MKKVIALTLAGAMVFSTPVMAKEVGAPTAEYEMAAPAQIIDSWYWVDENGKFIERAFDTYTKDPVSVLPSYMVNGAIARDMTVAEYAGNAVTDIWAMDEDEVQDLAIGQGAVLDGVEAPGLTFELLKPDLKRVYAAKELAQGNKGTLLNVVNVHTHAGYSTAKVTFYAPGVKAGQAITVYQRVTDDNWVAVPTVVADDHVTVDITDNTHLAFIEAK